MITWMKDKNHFRSWLLPMIGVQDGIPYDGLPVSNIPKFVSLDRILNRDILHSFQFHCVLSRFVLDGEGTSKE